MHSHGIVGRDGAVQKTPAFLPGIFPSQLLERVLGFPELQNGVFTNYEIAVRNGLKHDLQGLPRQKGLRTHDIGLYSKEKVGSVTGLDSVWKKSGKKAVFGGDFA
jgi:hypothetical protein